MKTYLSKEPWRITEDGFEPSYNRVSESIFSLGNGQMGHRGNFEEAYSGDTFQGSYLAGVYYPDKTRVGWWKNGYPEYFAKVLNASDWIGMQFIVNGQSLDLAKCEVIDFTRSLDMQHGYLERKFKLKFPGGEIIQGHIIRFCSQKTRELGWIKYTLKSINFSGKISWMPYIDFDVENEDTNYDEKFWNAGIEVNNGDERYVTASTKKTDFEVCTGMHLRIMKKGQAIEFEEKRILKPKYISSTIEISIEQGEEIEFIKSGIIVSSFFENKEEIVVKYRTLLDHCIKSSFERELRDHQEKWLEIWENSDIMIEGDVSAQQAIRFNIFQLYQTYTGHDSRLNIGPKGFTGEKYGGSTYWDTEAYCLPFYQSTSDPQVARNLLIYRHNHLPKAIENAQKLGFHSGAALYPMVTINGEECHNEWEITFEEIHRNGAIAYAISDYIKYTDDQNYLQEYGLEVLIGISRFWAQRVNWSEDKQQYVMLGVTGPNEYENNVNNNWYTNYLARWCLNYTSTAIIQVKGQHPSRWSEIESKTSYADEEQDNWNDISSKMYLPHDEKRKIFLQQDGFLDKVLSPVLDIPSDQRPINQHWSWDRILRSCYIKQADVLQGLYFFEEDFNLDQLRSNFDFYEPLTVHESSLSPCVHSILACRLGKMDKAYEMYLRTARLDLDDYNNDTEDGLHITSMAGTWLSIVKGFGGMRIKENRIYFSPNIPDQWEAFSFRIQFRNAILNIRISKTETTLTNLSENMINCAIQENEYTLQGLASISIPNKTL